MRKVLFIDKAHPFLENRLTQLGFECHTDIHSNVEQLEQSISEYTGVILRSRIGIDKNFIDKASRLAFIAREGVGLEHIDASYAKEKGIEVLYSPEGSRDTVGEHTLALLLCLLNNTVRADSQVRQGQWVREANRGIELKGKTAGILGYGNMGSSFARKLQGMEVNVLAWDKYKKNYSDGFAEEVSLERLQQESDILSLHIHYDAENHYFVNSEFIEKFSKPLFIINTSRGLVLKTDDLVHHLKTGKVRGAALDVLEYEETSFDKFKLDRLPDAFEYLCKAENVILSPHIAGWSFESKEKHARVLAEKIECLF